jgi:hypothetical protein
MQYDGVLDDRVSVEHDGLSEEQSPVDEDESPVEWVHAILSRTNEKETTNAP